MGRTALDEPCATVDPPVMRHPELLPFFCFAIALEAAHLRWILLTQWTCKGCGDAHVDCECKPAWVKKLL